MKPQDALKLLDQAASRFPGTREDHARLMEARRILEQFLAEHSDEQGYAGKPSELHS